MPGPDDSFHLGLYDAGTESNPGGSPHYLFFGNFNYQLPGQAGVTSIAGGIAEVRDFSVEHGNWTFDFGSGAAGSGVAQPAPIQGGLTADFARITGWDGTDSSLTLRNGTALIETVWVSGLPSIGSDDPRLRLDQGGQLSTSGLLVGEENERGTVEVQDSGSHLETGSATIGWAGQGILTVMDGASSSFQSLVVGGGNVPEGAAGVGEVSVVGSGSSLEASAVTLGGRGAGSFLLAEGTHAQFDRLTMAEQPTASGELNVRGTGTELTIGGAGFFTAIGQFGNATVNVEDGALVRNNSTLNIADNGSESSVNVRGSQTTWEQDGNARVGYFGNGTLNVSDSAAFELNGAMTIGYWAQSEGRVNVSNDGVIETSGALNVGFGEQSAAVVEISGPGSRVSTDAARIGSVRLTGGPATNLGDAESDAAVHVVNGGLLEVNNVLGLGAGDVLALNRDVAGNTYIGGQRGRVAVGNVDPSQVLSGQVVVGSGGTLMGSGTIWGNVLVQGGEVSPGFSPGTLDVTSLEVGPTGSLRMEIAGTGAGMYDQIFASETITLGGTLFLDFISGFVPEAGNVFNLFSASSGIFGSFADVQISGWNGDYGFSLTDNTFRFTVAPEQGNGVPDGGSGVVLLSLALMGLFGAKQVAASGNRPSKLG